MLAFSGCYYGGGEKERRELGEIRKRWETLPVSVFLSVSGSKFIFTLNIDFKILLLVNVDVFFLGVCFFVWPCILSFS